MPNLEAFEMAFFGRDVRFGRKPEGAKAVDRRPPWAGVLAFAQISPAGADDPVLFLAPGYDSRPLPAAVTRLKVRAIVPPGIELQTRVIVRGGLAFPGPAT